MLAPSKSFEWPLFEMYRSQMREMQRALTRNLGLWAWHNVSPLFMSRKSAVSFASMSLGDEAMMPFDTNERDTYYFGYCTRDWNDVHFSPEGIEPFDGPICHGMHLASYISCMLGTEFPGQGTIFSKMNNMAWPAPVRIGERVTVKLKIIKLEPKQKPNGFNRITFEATITKSDGTVVVTAEPVALVR